ncbi:Tn3 family transposase [Persicobacter psychrovividus]|uniref:Tn3 family transposase n=1 Tax=Persicobacter psychrovividus TaxID=387638 RepID=UPI003BAC7380
MLHQGNQWTYYTQYFQPILGNEAKPAQNKLHQIYALFAFGHNLGAYQTVEHSPSPSIDG